ncbi:hypothetical protein TYRP_019613 [Tyrophagus putrescentiae]|nr:hypothetical protein TYRP_019613 [Tyrophagus putrescentiae]
MKLRIEASSKMPQLQINRLVAFLGPSIRDHYQLRVASVANGTQTKKKEKKKPKTKKSSVSSPASGSW